MKPEDFTDDKLNFNIFLEVAATSDNYFLTLIYNLYTFFYFNSFCILCFILCLYFHIVNASRLKQYVVIIMYAIYFAI